MTEYNCDTNPYPCSGKKYNGEKAIISLTSWKARIGTVHKTIVNLLGMCPGFHVVLCLSEEEFPKKEVELPDSLMRFVNADLIEILWVYKNYKAFKKVIFTMDKYKDVPVISADDDCFYICNYAEDFYNYWQHTNKKCIIRWSPFSRNKNEKRNIGTQGPCTLYSPENNIFFSKCVLENINNDEINKSVDDTFADTIITKYKINLLDMNNIDRPYRFYTSIGALHPNLKNHPGFKCYFLN